MSESNAGTQVLEDAEREQWKVEITQVRASSSRRTGREGRAVVVVRPFDQSRSLVVLTASACRLSCVWGVQRERQVMVLKETVVEREETIRRLRVSGSPCP